MSKVVWMLFPGLKCLFFFFHCKLARAVKPFWRAFLAWFGGVGNEGLHTDDDDIGNFGSKKRGVVRDMLKAMGPWEFTIERPEAIPVRTLVVPFCLFGMMLST